MQRMIMIKNTRGLCYGDIECSDVGKALTRRVGLLKGLTHRGDACPPTIDDGTRSRKRIRGRDDHGRAVSAFSTDHERTSMSSGGVELNPTIDPAVCGHSKKILGKGENSSANNDFLCLTAGIY